MGGALRSGSGLRYSEMIVIPFENCSTRIDNVNTCLNIRIGHGATYRHICVLNRDNRSGRGLTRH